ncbi:MAG: DNA mismatch endonuclease Vsr [Pirellulaceae bacterium]|nr:DNA mismatch endonuclease Vsr [Pirellulaceae bacterium]
MDRLTPAERSKRMSLIRSKNTKPELVVRSISHRLGFRFRLHRRNLPGTPDLVFPRLRKVIDVRGCFWHSHACRRKRSKVRSRVSYWHPKLAANIRRDRRSLRQLKRLGWDVLVIWECQTRDLQTLTETIALFLAARPSNELLHRR